ncbi:hypothetical protein F4777DRAFT_442072 [Nemania sp. FL0916]|nr:hypothetical protein F4777DRAFT_442072 [Nemania sp. FL0916]
MANLLTPQEAKRLIESCVQIHRNAFQVALGVLTGLALVCFFARMAIRLTYHKGLSLDDVFLIIAAASLSAATGIIYHISYFLYLHSAALLVPEVLPYLLAQYDELIQLQKMVYPFLALIWTTIFAVKGCFLAFMRPLVWHISRAVNWYYWFIVVFSVISWAFVVAEPFILCPYFGLEASSYNPPPSTSHYYRPSHSEVLYLYHGQGQNNWPNCLYNRAASTTDRGKTIGLTAFITVLDILSDIMVVSLPIIILRKSLLSRSTKIGLGIFLSLSIFMAICAIIRIAGFYYKGLEDDVWEFFWQHVEGAVSVMMASITAFRTLFVKQASHAEVNNSSDPPQSFLRRLFHRFQTLARAQPEEKPTSVSSPVRLRLPKVPSPIFTGMWSFIRRNNRTDVSATCASLDSVIGDAGEDYHAVLKAHTLPASGSNTSSHDQSSSRPRS